MIFTSSRHADPGHDITHRDNAVTQQSLRVIDANPSLREPDPVAAGALDGHDQPRSGGVVEDPGQHLGIAGGVVC